jgi:hypothetical protein
MNNVYVVMGSTGEYSDRTEWPVKAFMSEDAAKDLVLRADRRAKELAHEVQGMDYSKRNEMFKANELDPQIAIDYTGTTYYYMAVELVA